MGKFVLMMIILISFFGILSNVTLAQTKVIPEYNELVTNYISILSAQTDVNVKDKPVGDNIKNAFQVAVNSYNVAYTAWNNYQQAIRLHVSDRKLKKEFINKLKLSEQAFTALQIQRGILP
jgi:hypothetical protein